MQPMDKTPEMEAEALATEPDEVVASLEERLSVVEKERDEYLDMAQRLKAEFENFRRRNGSVRSEAYEDGTREMITAILPVIDNLERALEASPEKTSLCEGVQLVYKQLLEILEKKGVAVIDRVGEVFDPELENAVMMVDDTEKVPGTVADVLQKGYQMNDRVLRHAMVRVVAG